MTRPLTADEKAARLAALRAEAKALQAEQFTLIAARRNPRRFGVCERRLTAIWKEVDALEGRARVRFVMTLPRYGRVSR